MILEKCKNASPLQWLKLVIWTVILVAFLAWVGNFWWILVWPFIFDIYITKFIPWTWWKAKEKTNPVLYHICSWIDAIVFCLIAISLIFNYIFQNYKIPSSSLEKTLLVGDYLLVSKVAYGPRNFMTPLSFPLAQHTLPILNCKSYIEKPQLPYKRLKGFGTIQRNDIVVFNFPAGDTVALNMQHADYYSLCFYYGRERVNSDKATFGDIVYRPVDRRENYVKRCVALPGDTLQIVNNELFINYAKTTAPEGLQLNYFVQTNGTQFTKDALLDMGVTPNDVVLVNTQLCDAEMVRLLDTLHLEIDDKCLLYRMPLTKEMCERIRQIPAVKGLVVEPDIFTSNVFPLGKNSWTRDNYGPIWIPKKGATVKLDTNNIALYENIIRNYEHNTLQVTDSVIYINNEPASSYTFQMDYYWMMGDNRHNSSDSRFWGFVPEDHIVGRPVFIWLSFDENKSFFNGGLRFNRIFKGAKH